MNSIKILIIEDDTLIGMQLENTLEQMGHKVIKVVRDSDDAFKYAIKNDIDLVVSDINIEGDIDGITTSKILYERYGTPVIFITAYKDIETLKKASLVDYAGYVMKPFREEEIEALINLTILKYNLPKQKEIIKINEEYKYYLNTSELFYKNEKIELTKSEEKFLQLLINANGELITYSTIELNLWHDKVVSNETRRQLIYRLKKKLSNFPLELKKGVGYRLVI
jgi:DNA-binding response OmpR family regulator